LLALGNSTGNEKPHESRDSDSRGGGVRARTGDSGLDALATVRGHLTAVSPREVRTRRWRYSIPGTRD